MKKYGIYLAYAPEQDIRNQGLGRLLAFIISGAIENRTSLVLAYPKWYESEIRLLCDDHNIDFDKIDTITTNEIPILIRIKNLIEQFKKRKKRKSSIFKNFLNNGIKFTGKIFIRWLSLSNVFIFILFGLVLLSIFIILLPLIIPISISFGILYLLKFFLGKILKLKYIKILSSPLHNFKHSIFAHKVFDIIIFQELTRLNNKINKREEISAWLIPTLFWPEISSIKAKKVVVAPDIIFYDFPTHFNTPLFGKKNKKIISTIASADHFITYSDYVKKEHLQKPFSIEDSKITIISHGASDLSKYLVSEDSLAILKEFQMKKLYKDSYLSDYNIDNMKYIFYSSQIRPHKNFINLIKAYKILLREKFVNVKLITTANIKQDSDIHEFILKNRLQNDILSFYNVPSKVLAALNSRAICSVNPTLFEGGFPFTFLEAYTVGTPSIMGDIPMTSELIEDENLKNIMLFNPYSVKDMVDKIEWGINNKELLFKKQEKLYLKMKERSWSDVAKDYIEVLENASK
jgi:glycosyltransferase involved in cell wall biosynthesis